MKYCIKCGTQLPDEAMFCSKCGTRLLKEEKQLIQKVPEEKKKEWGKLQNTILFCYITGIIGLIIFVLGLGHTMFTVMAGAMIMCIGIGMSTISFSKAPKEEEFHRSFYLRIAFTGTLIFLLAIIGIFFCNITAGKDFYTSALTNSLLYITVGLAFIIGFFFSGYLYYFFYKRLQSRGWLHPFIFSAAAPFLGLLGGMIYSPWIFFYLPMLSVAILGAYCVPLFLIGYHSIINQKSLRPFCQREMTFLGLSATIAGISCLLLVPIPDLGYTLLSIYVAPPIIAIFGGILLFIIGRFLFLKEKARPIKEYKYCPGCGGEVKPEWLVCPNCGLKLKER